MAVYAKSVGQLNMSYKYLFSLENSMNFKDILIICLSSVKQTLKSYWAIPSPTLE